MKIVRLLALLVTLLGMSTSAIAQSYLSRLWNTKKYDQILTYSEKGSSLSGPDNMIVGQAFMAVDPPQPAKALEHYDLCIEKKWQQEELYFLRSEAHYAIKNYNAALSDLEVCLQMRPNHQKYLLNKAAIAYEKGDRDLAYTTYKILCDLYDKQLPFYMMATISIERGSYYKAQQQVDANMLRFERGKEFWTFTAEQQVELEWHVFKDYQKALKAQNALLSFKENNAEYLINRMLLLRLMGADSLATLAENDLQNRYNTNGLPLDYYKKGSFKVGEYERPNGIIEDYRYFRPNLYEDVKYARYYLSEGGQILGIHKAGLTERSKDSVPRFWNFERDQFYQMPATDTSYSGFKALFELPDSTLVSKVRFETGKLEVEELMPVQDTTSSLEER